MRVVARCAEPCHHLPPPPPVSRAWGARAHRPKCRAVQPQRRTENSVVNHSTNAPTSPAAVRHSLHDGAAMHVATQLPPPHRALCCGAGRARAGGLAGTRAGSYVKSAAKSISSFDIVAAPRQRQVENGWLCARYTESGAARRGAARSGSKRHNAQMLMQLTSAASERSSSAGTVRTCRCRRAGRRRARLKRSPGYSPREE